MLLRESLAWIDDAFGRATPVPQPDNLAVALRNTRDLMDQAQGRADAAPYDDGFWIHAQDAKYFEAVGNLLEAATIAGTDTLPNVPPPNLLDASAYVLVARASRYAFDVLAAARQPFRTRLRLVVDLEVDRPPKMSETVAREIARIAVQAAISAPDEIAMQGVNVLRAHCDNYVSVAEEA